jgi:hypothetical protein
MEQVLGQALEMELPLHDTRPRQIDHLWSWPGAVVHGGINLVPRPDLPGGRRFWLGATLEPAHERGRWQGLRCRPQGQPAPLLEQVAPGLLLLSGHYRNGVLLAPATAAWICGRIQGIHESQQKP